MESHSHEHPHGGEHKAKRPKAPVQAANVRTLNPAQVISVMHIAYGQIEHNALEIARQAARHKEWTALLLKDDASTLTHSFEHGSVRGMNTFIEQNSHALKALVIELAKKLEQFDAMKHITR